MICAYTYLRRHDGLPPGVGESQIVQDAVWVHSRPEDGLQHIRVRDDGAGLALHLFLRGTDAGEVSSRLERLLRGLRIVPALQAYQRLSAPMEVP
ncbi:MULTISPECIES: hypothetical protein [Streptomyces]|uniref:Uncharacterized protein n=1 Tax=Streptomyces sp. NBC_00093 TaxID=2975649 RepID=A0AAU2A053_9ACTN